MRILTQEFEPPQISEGAFIEGEKSLFSVVIPEATENLITNPSPVLAITGYTAMAGAVALSTLYPKRSANSIRVAPTAATGDGAYFGTVTTVVGWNTFSLDFRGYPGVPYKIYFADTSGNQLGPAVEFYGEGLWRRPEVKYYETAGTARRVYFTKNDSTDTNYFYVDGLQVEAKDHSTTFCMGDMVGFVPGQIAYYWTGAIYASTSIRIENTGSGGRVVPLSDYGFRLLGFTGLGVAPVSNISFPYARMDGEHYQTTRITGRDFSLLGEIGSASMPEFMKLKSDLADALYPSRTATRQPLVLCYQYKDESGNSMSDDIYLINCNYVDGLGGNTTNKYRERIGLNFRMANPYIALDGVYGTELDYQDDITASHCMARINGVWRDLGTGIDNSVYAVAVDKIRGRVWYGGWFVTADGVTVNNLCYWNGTTFVAVGGATKGTNGNVYGLAVMPNGDVWVVGEFTTAGGAATKGVAKWVNATDTFTVYNLTGTVTGFYNVAVDSLGNAYFGGNFTNWNGVAANAYAVEITVGGTWTTLGTVPYGANEYPDNLGRGIAVDKSDNVYFGSRGHSSNPGHLRKWTVSTTTWSDIGATPNDKAVLAVYVDNDGALYAGGDFTTFGGVTVNFILKYSNGVVSTLGSTPGLSGANGAVCTISNDGHGNLIFGGAAYIETTSYYSPIFLWNGSVFASWDGLGQYVGIGVFVDVWNDDIYSGWAVDPGIHSGSVAGITNITIENSTTTYPKVTFTGPTTASAKYVLLWLENQSTGERMHFNINVHSGETITLDFATRKITSSFLGVLANQPLGGSAFANFHLRQGLNVISCFAYGTFTGVTSSIIWKRTAISLG